MAITATGTGSGIDVNSLISQLVAAERTPRETILNQKEASLTSEISAYGTLRGVASTLESPLTALKNYSASQQVSVSNTSALDVTSDGTAENGSFTVAITQLAQAHKLATNSANVFTSKTENVGGTSGGTLSLMVGAHSATTKTFISQTADVGGTSGGNLTINVGSGSKTIAVAAGATLENVRDAINATADVGVTATIEKVSGNAYRLVLTAADGIENSITTTVDGTVNTQLASANMTVSAATKIDIAANATLDDVRDAIDDATGVSATIVKASDNAYHLVITGDETGAANKIDIAISGTLSTKLGMDSMEQKQAAQDAEAEIDGIAITSGTNTLTDVKDGLTFTLKDETDADSDITVNLSENNSALATSLQSFIASYNVMVEQVNSLTAYDAEHQKASVLTGDRLARDMRSSFSRALGYQTDDGLSLSALGVTVDRYGVLSFDASKYSAAISDYSQEDLETAVNDIADNMLTQVTKYTESSTGSIAVAIERAQAGVDIITEQRERLESYLEALQERLVTQYTAMDTTVANLKSLSSYLTTQFANLIGSSSD